MSNDPLAKAIKELAHVESVNLWEKDDKVRLYVNVASQNRFSNASTIYIDMTTGELVARLEKGKSGAKSYGWSVEVAEAIKALLAATMTEEGEETVERDHTYTMDLPGDFSDDEAADAAEMIRTDSILSNPVFGMVVTRDGLHITVSISPNDPEVGEPYEEGEIAIMHETVDTALRDLARYFAA